MCSEFKTASFQAVQLGPHKQPTAICGWEHGGEPSALMAFASCPGRLRHQLRIRFPIRTWLRLALCLIGIPVCAEVPQAHVNPIVTKLPIYYSSDIRFSLISTEDGLSQIRVSGIVQDNLGFTWFGTEYGLNRFDGYASRFSSTNRTIQTVSVE